MAHLRKVDRMCCGKNTTLWREAATYAKALYSWLKAGRPRRTGKEIEERFLICEKCEHFFRLKPWRGRCKKCGCYLGRHAKLLAIKNKIAMKTEKCPEGKWE